MKNNLLELLGIVLMITPSMLIGRYCLDVTSGLFWLSVLAASPLQGLGVKLLRKTA